MDIKQSLPFTHCENCPEFVLKVDEQTFFVDNITHRMIEVRCKNEWLCKQLEKKFGEVKISEQTMP